MALIGCGDGITAVKKYGTSLIYDRYNNSLWFDSFKYNTEFFTENEWLAVYVFNSDWLYMSLTVTGCICL